METGLTPEQARQRRGEICQTFGRLADRAAQEGVTALLIAGDLFDRSRVTAATVDWVLSVVEGHPTVDFLYLRGNHDESRRAFAGRTLPANLHTFSECWHSRRYGSIVISGVELTAANADSIYDTLTLNPEDTNLVMLHGQISTRSGENLVCLPRLRGKHIAYLALGHLHRFQSGTLDGEGSWCYSGCLEGRGFDECGEKGYVSLEVEDHRVTARFVPFARRTLVELPVDITGLETVPQLRQAMEGACSGVEGSSLVKFVLRGQCPPESRRDLAFLEGIFQERFYLVRIRDESRLALSPQDFLHDVSLRGEFVRQVMEAELPLEDRDRILTWGLQALRGEEVLL